MSSSYRGRSRNSYSRGSSGSSRGSSGNSGRSGRGGGGSRVTVIIITLVLLVAVGGGIVYAIDQNGSKPSSPSQSASAAPIQNSTTFYNGVYVDDIPLGGLTQEEAKKQVQDKQKAFIATAAVTVTSATQSWVYKAADLPYTYDTDAVLLQAFNQGRQGSDAENKAAVSDLATNPVKLKTTATVDYSSLEAKVRQLAEPFTVVPVNAVYTGYDNTKPAGQRLLFTPDMPGSQVDADALWAAVKKEFDGGTYGTVPMPVVPVPATVTLASLQADMTLLLPDPTKDHSYTTQIINNKTPRLTNIRLAGAAVSGFIQPGETFSFNDRTGERSRAKGYEIAPVDNNGISDDGLGGGTCQVSGTLYNAAIRYGGKYMSTDTTTPGLTVMERNKHSIPSAYMAKGTDATVDYGHYDLKLRNDFTKPILIVMYYDKDANGKYWEHADIYGPAMPDGATYNLVPDIVTTYKPLDGQRKATNSAVKPGTTKIFPAHRGYRVDVYVEKTAADGTKTRVKIYQDYYAPGCEVLAYYKNDPEPTDSPTPGPSDEETPAPTDAPTAIPDPTP